MEIAIKLLEILATPLAILILGYFINKRLDDSRRISEWKKVWADDFLECSNNYSSIASKIVVNMNIHGQIKNEKLDGWKERAKVKHCELTSYINQIKFYEWEIKKYIQFAPINGKGLDEASSHLFRRLKDFISYCNKPTDTPFNLEDIRTAQFDYNEAARKVHSELMGV